MKIKVTGTQKVIQALAKLDKKIQRDIIRKSIDAGLKPLLEEVLNRAPVDTGEHKKNIKVRAGKSRKGFISREIRVGDKQVKGWALHFIEFGTRNMPAAPFMAPSVDSQGQASTDLAARHIAYSISRESTFGGKMDRQFNKFKKTKVFKGVKKIKKTTMKKIKSAKKRFR